MHIRQAKTAFSSLRFCLAICSLSLLTVSLMPLRAKDTASPSPCARAEAEFLDARKALAAAPDKETNTARFGRAASIWADCSTTDQQRSSVAEEGIKACRAAITRDSKKAAYHYYLGQNLGESARTKSFGALKLLREMEKAWLQAKTLDEKYDFAGPDRSLGLLYLQAPGWPTSIGNNSKARSHLEQAVKLEPDYPDNRLSFAEALAKWHKTDEAKAQVKAMTELWSRAKARLTGPDWEASWTEWESRLTALKAKAK